MMVLDKNDPDYRQCSLSVMDNIADPDITFDENGKIKVDSQKCTGCGLCVSVCPHSCFTLVWDN